MKKQNWGIWSAHMPGGADEYKSEKKKHFPKTQKGAKSKAIKEKLIRTGHRSFLAN